MPKMKRHTAAEIAAKLDQAEKLFASGHTQSQVASMFKISMMTLHRWRKAKPFAARSDQEMAIMRAYPELLPRPRPRAGSGRTLISELETENAYLRKLVIDLLLEKIRQYSHRQLDDLDDGASRRRDRGRKGAAIGRKSRSLPAAGLR
jgi:putative transposase